MKNENKKVVKNIRIYSIKIEGENKSFVSLLPASAPHHHALSPVLWFYAIIKQLKHGTYNYDK